MIVFISMKNTKKLNKIIKCLNYRLRNSLWYCVSVIDLPNSQIPIVSRGSVIIELKIFSLIVSQEFFSLLSHERLKYQYKFLQLEIQSFLCVSYNFL